MFSLHKYLQHLSGRRGRGGGHLNQNNEMQGNYFISPNILPNIVDRLFHMDAFRYLAKINKLHFLHVNILILILLLLNQFISSLLD